MKQVFTSAKIDQRSLNSCRSPYCSKKYPSNVVKYPRIDLPLPLAVLTQKKQKCDIYIYTQGEQFDLVASLEVIEHVENHAEFVSSLAALTRPGGMVTLSTINRTAKVSQSRSPNTLRSRNISVGVYLSCVLQLFADDLEKECR